MESPVHRPMIDRARGRGGPEEAEEPADLEGAEEVALTLGAIVKARGPAGVSALGAAGGQPRGSGSHTWGTARDRLTDLDPTNVTAETPEGEEQPAADAENKENEVAEVKGEGPKEMTLDEWKAIQNKDQAKAEFKIRKPNEGADGQWKKGFVLPKPESEEAHAEDSVMDHHLGKPANEVTSQLEMDSGDLGRPGRGGRAGRGGRRGRLAVAGLTSQVLLLLQYTSQRHSQLWLSWMPRANPGLAPLWTLLSEALFA